jgi:hypothetical protein
VCVGGSQGVTFNTPTMTGETFVKITGASNAGAAAHAAESFYATNSAAGGQKQVTETVGTASNIHLHIFEISGQIGSPQDATGNTNGVTMSVSTSGATTTANDLVIAFFMDEDANKTLTATLPFVQIEQTNNAGGGDCAISMQNTVSATGVQTATGGGNVSDNVAAGILAIAGTASGSPSKAAVGGKAVVGGKVVIG